MWIERARIAMDRAAEGDARTGLPVARLALDSANAVLATRPQPRPLATLEWLRARAARLDETTVDSSATEEARAHLARARELVPADQDLPFARLLAAEESALARRAAGPRPAMRR
jgi:hypothetical protein